MTEVLTYEALKAERDAPAVENAALKSKAAELVHEASEVYSAYNATIKEPDDDFMDMQTLYEMQCIETPATDAALAAIEAQGVEKFADRMLTLANDPTYSTASHRNDLRDAGAKAMDYAANLRETK